MSPGSVSDDEIITALEQVAADETVEPLPAEGGYRPEQIAEVVGLSEKTLTGRLTDLVDDGRVTKVWGLGEHYPLRSFLPAGDDETQEEASVRRRPLPDGGRCRECGTDLPAGYLCPECDAMEVDDE